MFSQPSIITKIVRATPTCLVAVLQLECKMRTCNSLHYSQERPSPANTGCEYKKFPWQMPRLGLVRAMLMCADILLLDEPTGRLGESFEAFGSIGVVGCVWCIVVRCGVLWCFMTICCPEQMAQAPNVAWCEVSPKLA